MRKRSSEPDRVRQTDARTHGDDSDQTNPVTNQWNLAAMFFVQSANVICQLERFIKVTIFYAGVNQLRHFENFQQLSVFL